MFKTYKLKLRKIIVQKIVLIWKYQVGIKFIETNIRSNNKLLKNVCYRKRYLFGNIFRREILLVRNPFNRNIFLFGNIFSIGIVFYLEKFKIGIYIIGKRYYNNRMCVRFFVHNLICLHLSLYITSLTNSLDPETCLRENCFFIVV